MTSSTSIEPDAGAATPDGPRAAPGTSMLREPLTDRGALTWLAVGAVLLVGAGPLTLWLADVLPAGAQVRGAVGMPGFGEAFDDQVRWLGSITILAVMAHGLRDLALQVLRRVAAPRWWTTALGAALAAATAAAYWVLSTPHNAWEGNARVHWVEISSLRADNWFYTLVKLPHLLFYDQPALLQAINGTVNVLLVLAIGRAMFGDRRVVPLLMAASYLVSSSMLQFGSTADEVQLSITALLCAHLFHLRGQHRAMGVALMVATLARPQLITAAVSLGIIEGIVTLVRWRRDGGSLIDAVRRNPFITRTFVVFVSLFALWHLWLTVTGRGWFLIEGEVVAAEGLLSKKPVNIGGFTISRLSGAYVLHALWLYPAPMLASCAWAVARCRLLSSELRRHLLFGVTFICLGVLVSELFPLSYYNERYLTYYWPTLLVSSFTFLTTDLRRRSGGGVGAAAWIPATAVAVLLAGSSAATFHTAGRLHERLDREPGRSMFAERRELRDLVGDQRVYTTMSQTTTSNYLQYVLHRPVAPLDTKGRPSGVIEIVPPGSLPEGGLLITIGTAGYDDADLVWAGEQVRVYRPAGG